MVLRYVLQQMVGRTRVPVPIQVVIPRSHRGAAYYVPFPAIVPDTKAVHADTGHEARTLSRVMVFHEIGVVLRAHSFTHRHDDVLPPPLWVVLVAQVAHVPTIVLLRLPRTPSDMSWTRKWRDVEPGEHDRLVRQARVHIGNLSYRTG
jgi:hypothetical protein